MKLSLWIAAASAALLLAACAGVSVRPTTSQYDTTTPGFRLPERKPLVVLFGNKVDLLWVCNPNKSTAMEFGAFLAKHKFKMNFDACGAPTNIDSDIDSTEVPLKFLELLQDVVKNPPPGGPGELRSGTSVTTGGATPFQVFDVRFAVDDSITLVPLVDPHDIGYVKLATVTTAPITTVIPNNPPPPPADTSSSHQ